MSLYKHDEVSSSPLPSELSPRSSRQNVLAILLYGSQDRDPKREVTSDSNVYAVVFGGLPA
jgi:hypothetical protein